MHSLTGPCRTKDASHHSCKCNFLKYKEVQGTPVEFIAVKGAGGSSRGYKKVNDNPHLKTEKVLETFNRRHLNKHNKEAGV